MLAKITLLRDFARRLTFPHTLPPALIVRAFGSMTARVPRRAEIEQIPEARQAPLGKESVT